MQKVYIIDGFHGPLGIPESAEQAAREGLVELYNAARPMPCHELHRGAFVRGRYWAVVVPDDEFAEGYRERIRSLDGYRVEFVSQERVLTEMQDYYDREYSKYNLDVQEHPFRDVVLPWLDQQAAS